MLYTWGNWLLTSAKNHLESSWLQVNEKWFIALIVTAYSFMFEQMNSESSHHRRNGTWRWTLITGFDLLGIYWDKLTRSLTQDLLNKTHSCCLTNTHCTSHTIWEDNGAVSFSARSHTLMCVHVKASYASYSECDESFTSTGNWGFPSVSSWHREMMTQVDAVYYQFKRKHHRFIRSF